MARLRRHHRRCHRRRREDEGAEREMTPATRPSRPHFFKIILSHTLESGKLGIPKSFLSRHGKDLSGLVLLKVAGGSTWPVELEQSDNDVVWLWRGWREFMEHYSIGHGHFIVFKYEGDSTFHVIIFDKSASEIDYPLSIQSHAAASPEGEFVSRKEENVVEIEDSEGFVPRPWPSSNGSSREFGGPSSLPALELASKFESDHPFFKVVMRPAYVRNYLGIPREFFRKHVQKNKQVATLRYSDRLWQVKLRSYEHRKMTFLSTGWSSFVRETGLCARDVCVFELIDRDDIAFRVSIFTSDGRIEIEQSQCRESSSEPAFHRTRCLSPVSAPEKVRGFESDHPFFKVVMRPSYVWNKLGIPCEFFRKHVQKNKQVATLRYSDRLWQVKLRSYEHRGMAFLYTGWSSFVRETGLRVRDVCVFELIDRDDIVFRVSIFTSDGRIGIKQSQCRESSSEPAFHFSPCLTTVSAHEKARGFESDHPFFKVAMRPSYVSKYLAIPWEFFSKHVQRNKQVATLRYSDRSWQVKLRSYYHRRTAFFSTGWPSFARETGLRLSNVGVFELTDRDDIVFRVSIFRSDGRIEIEKPQCRGSSSEPAFHSSLPCLTPVTAHEKASKFESEHPFFHAVMLPNHMNRKLNIPWEFIKTYVREVPRMATLVSSGRSWEVKLYGYRRFHIACLAAGWPVFAREARLRGGDVCVFELIDRDNIVFRVSVFRNANKGVICID
ncbi:putative B3 domain-containing protein REM15 [Rhodamnia argentea]|uniref:B3 domain-containing protein REM15 n=1 Tax=Rhodamnia argentea TaxID=178133 RepID=A0ABM3HGH6_9MYRT|nr:putative B3 domain-containing protein REM15 [Rhodamnia argentea]